jgi:hypothetical protein
MSESASAASNPLDWLDAFQRHPAPELLQNLLTDRVYLGSLNSLNPDDLLLDWAAARGGDLTSVVDRQLANLIETRWGRDDDDLHPADLTWHRMMRMAASLREAPATTRLLWGWREDAERRLGPLVRTSARDALGWFWGAVSRAQPDESLVERWLAICRLDGETPAFHGRWGLLGLRRAPSRDPEALVAVGLLEYARAVSTRVERGDLEMTQADRLVTTEMNAARRAYPSPERWRQFWSSYSEEMSKQERDWVSSIFGINAVAPPPRAGAGS